MSDYTVGEMETMNAPFFGIEPEDIAHIAIIVQTMDGEMRALGCKHVMQLAEVTLHMKASDRNDLANQAFDSRAYDDGNINSPSRKPRQNRMARILRYLQFRTQIRYR